MTAAQGPQGVAAQSQLETAGPFLSPHFSLSPSSPSRTNPEGSFHPPQADPLHASFSECLQSTHFYMFL